MQTLSVAVAKARLSAVLAQVEAGEEIVITRRGVAIAPIVAEPLPGYRNSIWPSCSHSSMGNPCMAARA